MHKKSFWDGRSPEESFYSRYLSYSDSADPCRDNEPEWLVIDKSVREGWIAKSLFRVF